MQYLPAKTILTRTKGGDWVGTDYNMNLYRGCSHGCIYCDRYGLLYQMRDIVAGYRQGHGDAQLSLF